METNLGFLFNDVARLFRRRFDEAAREVGSTGAQWRALLVLQRCPGINQGKLAEILDVEPITSCRMIDRLEQAGLVERRRDPGDRRVWQLFVTAAAEPLTAELREIAANLLEAATSGLTPDEIAGLHHSLTVIRNTVVAMDENYSTAEARNG